MLTAFERAMAFTRRWEGGYTNDPDDPGGATNFGVTQGTYDAYRTRMGLPAAPVLNIEYNEIADIYREYWQAAHCDQVGDDVALVLFDSAFNLGPVQAVKLLQIAAGVEADGKFGPLTYDAVNETGPRELSLTVIEKREQFYRDLVARKPERSKFLRGWLNRTEDLRFQIIGRRT